MKNRGLNLHRYPTNAELYALEQAAKAARSEEVARLMRAAFAGLKGVLHA